MFYSGDIHNTDINTSETQNQASNAQITPRTYALSP